jgi:hypothetical protein
MALFTRFRVLTPDETYSGLVAATASTAVLIPILQSQKMLPISAYLAFG